MHTNVHVGRKNELNVSDQPGLEKKPDTYLEIDAFASGPDKITRITAEWGASYIDDYYGYRNYYWIYQVHLFQEKLN